MELASLSSTRWKVLLIFAPVIPRGNFREERQQTHQIKMHCVRARERVHCSLFAANTSDTMHFVNFLPDYFGCAGVSSCIGSTSIAASTSFALVCRNKVSVTQCVLLKLH